MDNVDLTAASKRGIVVVNAPESTVVSAAEHTPLLLALTRRIPRRTLRGGPLGAVAVRRPGAADKTPA